MKRIIKKVAVLGSGVMGSRIACHFAGIGIPVLLLDRAPSELNETEKAKNLSPDHPAVKNRIVNEALSATIKSNPSPLYTHDAIKKIGTGNFTDNLRDLGDYDWIIEVVVERLDIKAGLFAEVEKYRRPGTLISSNTSGIPIHLMTAGRSDDFKNIFAAHIFLIRRVICGCWKSFPPQTPIRKFSNSCCISEISTLEKPPCFVRTVPHLLPTGLEFSVLWRFSD